MNLLRYALFVFGLFSLVYIQSCGDNPYQQGQVIYEYHCANCHLSNGEGIAKLIPPLKNADYMKNNWDQLACIISNGLADTIMVNGVQYEGNMVGVNDLGPVELSNLINFINHEWNNQEAPFITADQIEQILEDCR